MLMRHLGYRLSLLALCSAVAAAAAASAGWAAEKAVLVIGRDASDIRTMDPARAAETTPPLILRAVYDTLVTVTADDYNTVKPMLAESWESADDGQTLVFRLRGGLKFASGNPLTAEDVKFSLDRLKNLKDQPAYLMDNIAEVAAVDPRTVKVTLADKSQPALKFFASTSLAILDSKLLQEHGGSSAADADKADTATQWLDNQSAGSGPYKFTAWERNSAVVMERNDDYWGPPAAFQRIIVKYMKDGASQLLALKNGDIDVAFNLTPEQIATLEGNPDIEITSGLSLDFAYITLTSSADLSPALAKPAARQAVAQAIDYDGIISSLLGGHAVRPASFLPIGMAGSTEELTNQIGYHTDLDKAKAALAEAGYPDGFGFELSYPTATFGGIPYDVLAQKIQSDLAKVGIEITLDPMTTTNFTSKYKGGKAVAAMWEWVPDIPDPYTWTEPAVNRVADRVHWEPSAETKALMHDAVGATDMAEAAALNQKLLRELTERTNYVVLFQPVYRVATRKSISGYRVSAAGWLTDLADVKPAE